MDGVFCAICVQNKRLFPSRENSLLHLFTSANWNGADLFHIRRCVNWIHRKLCSDMTPVLTSHRVSAEHLCELLARGVCAVTWLNPPSLWTKLNHFALPCTCLCWSVHVSVLLSTVQQPVLVPCVQVSLARGGIWRQLLRLMGFSFSCLQFAWNGPIAGSTEHSA